MNDGLGKKTSNMPNRARRRILRWIISIPSILGLASCSGQSESFSIDPVADIEPDEVQQNDLVEAPHRGYIELDFSADFITGNPFTDNFLTLRLVSPSHLQFSIDGFFDGESRYKARVYCAEVGVWHWEARSNIQSINAQQGRFQVVSSELPGKLRVNAKDSRQFMTDDGKWFLHIGDTAYRYFAPTEPHWQEYIDQANQIGFNKIRMWFCQNRYDIQILFSHDRSELNVAYWQHIDSRLKYAFEHYPHIQLQLIPYAEDTDELNRYGRGDVMSHYIGRYFQARYSAFPNIHWCLSNDRVIYKEGEDTSQMPDHKQVRLVLYETINKLGHDFYHREPWGTLITNHQSRFDGYDFYEEVWSSINLLGDQDEISGDLILLYRGLSEQATILSEDRYEVYAAPRYPRYYFRRMMWSSLLSGGHATYGGLTTSEAFDGYNNGVQGYQRLSEEGRLQGATDFSFIVEFFRLSQLDLINMHPDKDIVVGLGSDTCACYNEHSIVIYIANPHSQEPGASDVSATVPTVQLQLPDKEFIVRWYNPRDGSFITGGLLLATISDVVAPGAGDWVLYLKTSSKE